jgi:protein SCO1
MKFSVNSLRQNSRGAKRLSIISALCIALAFCLTIQAQTYSAEKPLGMTAQQTPSYLAHAGIEQRLGQPLPLDAVFTDSTGQTGPIRSWFTGKPVVFALVYYKCSMLCPQVLHGLATGLKQTMLQPGKDYDILVFSIDPMDKPADAVIQKRDFLREMGHPEAEPAVHFLTGSEASIAAISASTGFHYVRVPGPDGKMDQFAHSSVIMFATPDGRISKYLSGIDYPPRDIRMSLLDASAKRISNPVDLLILYCCNYNPAVGRYSVSIMRVMGIAGMFALAVVIGMLILLTRKPKAQAAA